MEEVVSSNLIRFTINSSMTSKTYCTDLSALTSDLPREVQMRSTQGSVARSVPGSMGLRRIPPDPAESSRLSSYFVDAALVARCLLSAIAERRTQWCG
jgi:hypothetical protein